MNYMARSRRSHSSDTILRARRDESLSEDQLRAVVPAIFADHAHESRSDRYTYLPTLDVVRALQRAGFKIVEARQSRSRDLSKRGFTKHMLRFRPLESPARVGDTVPEAVLINAHDGSARYHLMSALLKLLCLNGMVVPSGPDAEVSVRHTGDIVGEVVEGTAIVLDNAIKALDKPREWSKIQLTDKQRNAFASAARVLRFGDSEGRVTSTVQPQQLLHIRRTEDAGHDLWSTFNVVQENVIRGGLSAPSTTASGRVIRRHTREVSGIDQDVKLNKALWVLAEELAEKV